MPSMYIWELLYLGDEVRENKNKNRQKIPGSL